MGNEAMNSPNTEIFLIVPQNTLHFAVKLRPVEAVRHVTTALEKAVESVEERTEQKGEREKADDEKRHRESVS